MSDLEGCIVYSAERFNSLTEDEKQQLIDILFDLSIYTEESEIQHQTTMHDPKAFAEMLAKKVRKILSIMEETK